MKKRVAAFMALVGASAVALQIVPASCAAAGNACVGLYADAGHSQIAVSGSGFTEFTVWVWMYLPPEGASGFEYKLSYPDNVLRFAVAKSPFIIDDGDPDDPAVGIRATFNGCKTGWVWSHYQYCYLLGSDAGKIRFVGHPESEAFLYHDCDAAGTPHVPYVYNSLFLNQPVYCCGSEPPYFMHLAVESPGAVRARLTDVHPSLGPERFLLIGETSPPETIRVTQAVLRDSITYGLAFESPMRDHVTYVLRTMTCSMPTWCSIETWRFLYEGPIATELKRCALCIVDGAASLAWEVWELDPGVTFQVARSADDGPFETLEGRADEETPLCYRYIDRNVDPGRAYAYRLECLAGGERRILYTSDRVLIPAERFVLHQNVPNPFNPSTKISFALPDARDVTLEIYDVTGHLVVRLLDGERLPGGTHAIDWNGSDGAGYAASSGIYLYRLRAGKASVSRKMVLLR